MATERSMRIAITVLLFVVFGLGYVCGSLSQPKQASAQLPGGLLDKATQGGGSLGTISKLGSSITEMEQHVSGLQKNLDTLKTIQSALTGK